jgi:hypothetical protein
LFEIEKHREAFSLYGLSTYREQGWVICLTAASVVMICSGGGA